MTAPNGRHSHIRSARLSADAIALITELEAYLDPLYPAKSRHGYSVEKLLAQAVAFFVLRENDTSAGCGGIQLFGTAYGELKRMYVRPHFRGLGFGKLLLDHLADQRRKRTILDGNSRHFYDALLFSHSVRASVDQFHLGLIPNTPVPTEVLRVEVDPLRLCFPLTRGRRGGPGGEPEGDRPDRRRGDAGVEGARRRRRGSAADPGEARRLTCACRHFVTAVG